MKKKIIIRSLGIFWGLVFIIGMAKGWHLLTGGFQMHKIREAKNYELPLRIDEMDSDVSQIFDQKFHYFSKGCQAYVFESEDGLYVLKFFRHHKYRTPFWMSYFTAFDWGKNMKNRRVHFRKRAFANTMNSYQLAATHLREESGTLFAHLKMTDHLKKQITLQDRIGRKWNVNLDNRLFILQKKADKNLSDALWDKKKKNDLDGAQHIVSSFFSEVTQMMKKGIIIRDYNCIKNLAIWDNTVHMIDLGSFFWLPNYKDPMVFDKEITHFSKRLFKWCRKSYPELLPYLEERLDGTVAGYYHEVEEKQSIQ